MNEINEFVEISKYAGERFDLVQAGGGNSSVKLKNNEMLIKASGFLLSDVDAINGYSKVYTTEIANIVKNKNIINEKDKRKRETLASTLIKNATIDTKNRPSIETLLHSFLYKYTLHTHPLVVNMITIKKNYKEILLKIFGNEEIAFVPYDTPGIELALTLDAELKAFDHIPNIIFLQNHGLITTSDDSKDIKKLTEYVLEKIENYLNLDMSRYKLTNKITKLVNSIDQEYNISYLSEDIYLNHNLKKNPQLFDLSPFCPDSLVYCGIHCCKIDNLFDVQSLQEYKKKFFELPKVILYKDNLFFVAQNVKKAKEMEDVFKFHIMVLVENIADNKNFLEMEELAYLSNWEAENFRRKL